MEVGSQPPTRWGHMLSSQHTVQNPACLPACGAALPRALPTRPLHVALDAQLLVILSFSGGLAPPGMNPPLLQLHPLLEHPLPPYLFPSPARAYAPL